MELVGDCCCCCCWLSHHLVGDAHWTGGEGVDGSYRKPIGVIFRCSIGFSQFLIRLCQDLKRICFSVPFPRFPGWDPRCFCEVIQIAPMTIVDFRLISVLLSAPSDPTLLVSWGRWPCIGVVSLLVVRRFRSSNRLCSDLAIAHSTLLTALLNPYCLYCT